MRVRLHTRLIHIFSGTYETFWQPSEFDSDTQSDFQLSYNFADLMKSIATAYEEEAPTTLSRLQEKAPYITAISFPGTFFAPKEYNFTTDLLDFVLTINYKVLGKTLDGLKGSEKFAAFLRENYSSRDGFFSFTPNNYEELRDSILYHREDFEQSLSAITNYLCEDSFQSIEEGTFNRWNENEYCGLRYEIEREEIAA